MTLMKPSASLDTWRDYFRRGDSDIFGIIEHAIMVADTDSPEELRSRRHTIVELLFSCQGSRCIGCDQPDLSKSGDNETNNGRKTMDTDDGAHEEDEMKLNNSQIVDEVMRIKDILLNKNDEVLSLYFNYIRGSDNFRPSVLFESLRNLTSMSITLDLIKGSEIGKAVNRLRKHGSDKISKLAKTLIEKWKEMVDQLINMPKEVSGNSSLLMYLSHYEQLLFSCPRFIIMAHAAADDGTPEFATLSIVDEAEDFPSLPHDLDFYALEPTAFELSQILDSLDCDGNICDSVEPKHERKLQSNAMKKPEGTYEANVVGRDKNNQQIKKKEAYVKPMRHSASTLDEPIRQPKQTREQMVHAIKRKPIVVADSSSYCLCSCRYKKIKGLDPEAKFKNAKRRFQEAYQQHEKAKRRRTIQVLEMPKSKKSPETAT
uniref:TFIIS N-terminal domain-containing protein n=1 Tax=Brassica oleracea var. oleracea TaxID=109376 RepID=A0A0D3CP56_BRAOL